jgi:AraC-like DNA-binding protein
MNDQYTIPFDRDQNRLNTIKAYIKKNIANNLHMERIARQFNISPSTLKRLFSEHEGMSYRQYLEQVRLTTAFQLLQQGHLSVKEVMYESGYKNRGTFNTAFKRKYGSSPAHFMK